MARPTLYTAELAKEVLDRLSEGATLTSACKADGMPCRSKVYQWISDNVHGFAEAYARAREIGAWAMADALLEVSDDGSNDWMEVNDPENPGWRANGEHIQRSRLRVDSRKWLLSKVLPKVFGDKLDLNHSGELNVRNLTDEQLAAELARLRAENEHLARDGAVGGAESASPASEDRSGAG